MNPALANILGIAVCGLLGGFASWAVVAWLQLTGVAGVLLALLLGMVLATAAFTAGIALLRLLGWAK